MTNPTDLKKEIKDKMMVARDFYLNNKLTVGILTVGVVLLILAGFFYSLFFVPVKDFTVPRIVTIEEGSALSEVVEEVTNSGIVKSSFWLRNTVIAFQGETKVIAGDYYFNKPESLISVARRITQGDYGLEPIRITVPEGLNVFEIADLLEKSLVEFDRKQFLAEAEEGYLFPDTYLLSPNIKTRKVLSVMRENFDNKTASIKEELKELGKDFDDIVNLASILETEARTTEARRKIAGILKNRLEIGMPLQVDVTFKYINGKNTYQLTREDLQIDSPYNTYVYTGLPPTPIANPGMDSILAAIDPIESDYMYFLSDRSGNMYYAKNFDDHIYNRRFMNN